MANFVKLTRIYVVAKTGEIKEQPIYLNVDAVASIRPSNRLNPGDLTPPAHRTTVTMLSGGVFDLSDKFSVVEAALNG